MSVRIYIVILFFWALLTAVTPTLVRLAASANHNSRLDGEGRVGVKLLLPRKALVEAIVSVPVSTRARAPALTAENGGVSDGEDAVIDKLGSHFDRS